MAFHISLSLNFTFCCYDVGKRNGLSGGGIFCKSMYPALLSLRIEGEANKKASGKMPDEGSG
jgi:hypothetical protein